MPLIDAWAWVEYFRGTPVGARIRPYVEGGQPATCILSIAELADLHARDGRPGLPERLAFIAGRGPILDVTSQAAVRAGATKWAQRSAGHPMGLGDALIYEVARDEGLDVVTGDPGFVGLDGVRFIATERT